MKKVLLSLIAACFCLQAQADETCEVRDSAPKFCPNVTAPEFSYDKSSVTCPEPKSTCARQTTPINASLECRGIGGGVLWCSALPTSSSNALTYQWTFIRNGYQTAFTGFGGATMEITCEQNTAFDVQLVVRDIFNQVETVSVSELCLVGSEN